MPICVSWGQPNGPAQRYSQVSMAKHASLVDICSYGMGQYCDRWKRVFLAFDEEGND